MAVEEKVAGIPRSEHFYQGHVACKGCGAALAMRFALKALGPKTVLAIPACCWSVIPGIFPNRTMIVPVFNIPFEVTGAVISGISEAFAAQGKTDINVVGWAGDGGTVDIGIQALSGAVERRHNFIYFLYDNEAYMNTGIQRSGSTPQGAWTTTTPVGKTKMWKMEPKKNIDEILIAHGIPYLATATIAFPEDLIKKVKKAQTIKGPKFIHILSPCQPGWKHPPEKTVEISRLAVYTKVFPLYEYENGKYRITVKIPEKKMRPVVDYLKLQGRFKYLLQDKEMVDYIQKYVDRQYELLLKKVEFTQSLDL